MQAAAVYLNNENSAGFYSLAAEYLPDSDTEKMRARAALFPKSFIALTRGNEVIGVCFGWARKLDAHEDNSFVLDGIAVRAEYQKNGYGKLLLKEFQRAAEEYGFQTISVGSAEGYVEKFYIDFGFVPKEYKVWEGNFPQVEKTFEDTADYYSYERKNPDGFVVFEKRLF